LEIATERRGVEQSGEAGAETATFQNNPKPAG